ncbi:hypothetical protein V8G54_000689 [Vigna mungo]|uniref:Uncharacterized protein n=1 Tax=Vigna mungo TaxID=3915 RepID=A0AAQ3P6F7_VIGMU
MKKCSSYGRIEQWFSLDVITAINPNPNPFPANPSASHHARTKISVQTDTIIIANTLHTLPNSLPSQQSQPQFKWHLIDQAPFVSFAQPPNATTSAASSTHQSQCSVSLHKRCKLKLFSHGHTHFPPPISPNIISHNTVRSRRGYPIQSFSNAHILIGCPHRQSHREFHRRRPHNPPRLDPRVVHLHLRFVLCATFRCLRHATCHVDFKRREQS